MENSLSFKIECLETKIKHLDNELRLTKQEKESAKDDYFNVIENMDKVVLTRTKEIKELQLVLKNKANELQLMLDASPSMIFYTDTEHRYIRVNKEFARIFELSVTEIIGKTFSEIYKDGTDYFAKENAEVMETDKAVVNRSAFIETDSGRIEVLVNKIPNKNIDGNVVGIIGFALDVSELRRTEEEKKELEHRLEQSKKMEAIGRLAGGVAHDLNNVLGALVGYPDLILLNLPKDNPMRNAILTIQNSGKKAAAIVQDLLTLARRGVLVNKVINLNEIILEYLGSLEFEKLKTFNPKMKLDYRLDPDLFNMQGSSVHLSKMVMNLVTNAAEAIINEGEIIISTKNLNIQKGEKFVNQSIPEGAYVELNVSDNGTGISKIDQEKIFEPFYTKKVMGISGTGLGLSVVWGTIEDHNGYVIIESKKGAGTTFRIVFPISKESIEKKKILNINDFLGNKERILIADDVLEMREITSVMLKKLNYKPSLFSSGERVINYLKAHKADLVLLDMIMEPGLDGFDTTKEILKIRPDQKIIIFSGYSETERVMEAQKLGAGEYLKKPFTVEQLGAALKKELKA